MSEWALVFLGVLALCAVVQCAFVVVAALSLRRSGDRVTELCQRFDADIKPTLEDLRKGAANLRAISESGREQALRVEGLVSSALGSLEAALENVRTVIVEPLASLTELSAFWSGLRRGLEAYRSAEPKTRKARTSRHRPAEDSDEHMFIG
jgi:threonine synthase